VSSLRAESVILWLSLAVFAALALWVAAHYAAREEYYPPYSTYSPRPEGAKALYELLKQEGFSVERYGDLEYDYPEDSCVIALAEPELSFSSMFYGQLDANAVWDWLDQGGRLIYASDPMLFEGTSLLDELLKLELGDAPEVEEWRTIPREAESNGSTGGEGYYVHPAVAANELGSGGEGQSTAIWRSYQPGTRFALPDNRPPLWADVSVIEVGYLQYFEWPAADVLLGAGRYGWPVVLYRQIGTGEIYWIVRPEICANGWLNRSDNHRVLLALVDRAAPDGTVYFDEHIHGYQEQRHNALSLLLSTTGGRLLLALGAALVLLFLGAAVRPARSHPQPVPPRRQSTEMVLAQADLYQRAGAVNIIVESLLDGVRRSFMQAFHLTSLPTETQLGAWLREQQAELKPVHRSALEDILYRRTSTFVYTPQGLLRLAQACTKARQLLERSPYKK